MKKTRYAALCVLLAIIISILNVGTTYSATLNELNQQKSDVQSQKDQAEKELEELEAQMSEVQRQVSQLSTQISEYQGKINTLQMQIAENEEKLRKAEADYKKQNDLLADRIIAQYEEGDTTYLDFLLNSESLTDFISNYYLIGEIAEMDVSLLKDIEKTKKAIEETKAQLETDKKSLESEVNVLQSKKAEREAYVSQLSAEEQTLQAQRDEYDSQLESLTSEIAAAEAALRRKNESSNKSSEYTGSGTMAWPLPGYSIDYSDPTNLYGYRLHPIYHDWRLHSGIDVAAPYGAKFVAAESGTVIVAGWYGGYGNCVVISHGGGISTLYGHGSSILVSEGEYVTKGTPVLAVGSSGVSTGAHAHFEVRKNGYTVDPLPYIT